MSPLNKKLNKSKIKFTTKIKITVKQKLNKKNIEKIKWHNYLYQLVLRHQLS